MTTNLPFLGYCRLSRGDFYQYPGKAFLFARTMSKKATPLPVDLILESLEIDLSSSTGLRWKARPEHHFKNKRGQKIFNGNFSTKEAGCLKENNETDKYFILMINGRMYRNHRIVYFLSTGIDPIGFEVDHIDNNGLNNRPENLRLATHTDNQRNRGKPSNNTSGKKGVFYAKQVGKWCAQITINGRKFALGYFDDVELASRTYEQAAKEAFGGFYREGQAT